MIKLNNDINNGVVMDENTGTVINQPYGTTVIQQPVTLWDENSCVLRTERALCAEKLWELRSKRILPFIWGIFGIILTIYCLLKIVIPNLFGLSPHDLAVVYMAMFFGVVIPLGWLIWIRKQDDELLVYYKARIKLIKHILRVRGDY